MISHLPSVDRVLALPDMSALIEHHGRKLVLEAVREELAEMRRAGRLVDKQEVAQAASIRVSATLNPSLRQVFNLTGTVLHTNLGRAPLPEEAVAAVVRVATGASNLEYDLATGERGDRDSHVEDWLCRLTGAQAATVVNNNAAAVLLALNTLAARHEVIVSRGELIEIGGAFRLPDIMTRAGCRLREVGTTNRTHLRDFAEAISSKTALLMKAHTSNYRIQGFTAQADEKSLGALSQERGLPLFVDLGSGTLIDLRTLGLPHEPTPAETLANGASLVSFSGDKLLGGPQVGMLVGSRELIQRIKRNPMKRAMRCDKMTLAALEAVLRLYARPERLTQTIPALRQLCRTPDEIATVGKRLLGPVSAWFGDSASVELTRVHSQVGSGSLPVDLLPSMALRIRPVPGEGSSRRRPNELAARLRALSTPVIGRIADGAVLLDLRCLEDETGFVALFQAGDTP